MPVLNFTYVFVFSHVLARIVAWVCLLASALRISVCRFSGATVFVLAVSVCPFLFLSVCSSRIMLFLHHARWLVFHPFGAVQGWPVVSLRAAVVAVVRALRRRSLARRCRSWGSHERRYCCFARFVGVCLVFACWSCVCLCG